MYNFFNVPTFQTMIQKKLALLLLSSIALSGCVQSGTTTDTTGVPTTKTNLSTEQKQQLQQLIDKTKKNLIFVKGGYTIFLKCLFQFIKGHFI